MNKQIKVAFEIKHLACGVLATLNICISPLRYRQEQLVLKVFKPHKRAVTLACQITLIITKLIKVKLVSAEMHRNIAANLDTQGQL